MSPNVKSTDEKMPDVRPHRAKLQGINGPPDVTITRMLTEKQNITVQNYWKKSSVKDAICFIKQSER